MSNAPVFGLSKPHIQYTERRAAYVVVINNNNLVALVAGRQKFFLPGGGASPGETAEDTIVREVREELARGVHLTRRLGEATQYFYAAADDQYYKMHAVFFVGEFTNEIGDGTGEHELHWLPVQEVEQACFHACHVWAVHQACRTD